MPDFSTWLKQLWLQDAVSLPISGEEKNVDGTNWAFDHSLTSLAFLPAWSQQQLPLRSRGESFSASPLSMLTGLRSLEQLGLSAPLNDTSLLSPEIQPFLNWLQQSVWSFRDTTLWVHRELSVLPILQEHLGKDIKVAGLNFDASQSLPLVWSSLFGSQQLEVPMAQLFPQLNGWMWMTERNHVRIPMEAETSLRPDSHTDFHPVPGQKIETRFQRLLGQGIAWEWGTGGPNLQGMWMDLSWKDCWLGCWKWPLGPEQTYSVDDYLDFLEAPAVPVELVLPAFPWMNGYPAQNSLQGQPGEAWFEPENDVWKPLVGQQVWLQGWKQINQFGLEPSKRRKGHPLGHQEELLLDGPFGYAVVQRPTGLCLHCGNVTRSQW